MYTGRRAETTIDSEGCAKYGRQLSVQIAVRRRLSVLPVRMELETHYGRPVE